jgi:hypothetical protein
MLHKVTLLKMWVLIINELLHMSARNSAGEQRYIIKFKT